MNEFGLSENTMNKLDFVFRKYPEIQKVILYGSRAMGNYKNGSDIDITLEGNSLTLNFISKLENDIDDLLLPYTFDISIFEKISNPDLKDHIKRVGKNFYQE
jgi:uncharacterized protein